MAAFVAKQVVGNKLNAVKGTHLFYIISSVSPPPEHVEFIESTLFIYFSSIFLHNEHFYSLRWLKSIEKKNAFYTKLYLHTLTNAVVE